MFDFTSFGFLPSFLFLFSFYSYNGCLRGFFLLRFLYLLIFDLSAFSTPFALLL